MLRNSTLLAIALSVTVIASATIPAAASSSRFMGGASNHLVSQLHPATAATGIQPSQDAHHVLTPVSPPQKIAIAGSKSTGSSQYPYPKPGKTSVGKIEEPFPNAPNTKPLPHLPPTCEALPNCKPNGPGPNGGSGGGQTGGKSGGGAVVILAPGVQVPAVPYGVLPRVTSAPSYVAAVQPRPAVASQPITPQCGAAGSIPALAAGIDQLLPNAQLSEADMRKITEFRQVIQILSTDGKVAAARDVEEISMNILGYQKVWLRCGLGTFDWEKQVATTDAVQQK
jgi:hypothetical protein